MNPLDDYFQTLIGVCPSCGVLVPIRDGDQHARWHKERDEADGPLQPFSGLEIGP